MEVVASAMGSLVVKLGELLMEELGLQKGVREQVQSLARELEEMHATLRKVAEVPPEKLDDVVKLWARDVRELSYDTEDIVDDFLLRVDHDGGREEAAVDKARKLKRLMEKIRNFFNCFSKGKARHEIAVAVEEMKKKVQEVAERHGRYTVHDIPAEPAATPIDPRILAMYKQGAELVGVDGPRDTIIKMLSYEDDDASSRKKMMKVVSIVGIGGLGKTTLAKAVYDYYKKLQPGFDCWAFVPVGRNPVGKKLLGDILFEIHREIHSSLNMEMLGEQQLIDVLRELLANKRYFVVIDDIWDKVSWDSIRCALPDNRCGSNIVTTTRISEIATYVGNIYKMQPLCHENSEKLLRTRIVDCEDICSQDQHPEIYDKIFQKCGGVPLAIITIASLLASKPREDWSEVYNSIGFGDSENDQANNTRIILSYSYYDMPCHLKTCLLYLSMFPEDYIINKHSLIWKWISEGFINKEQGIGPFEVGERYFNELINRSMIQPVEDSMIQRVKYPKEMFVDGCRVHDMVLDLVRSLSSKENFVTILESDEGRISHSKACVRRLCIQNNIILEQAPDTGMSLQHVRSFVAFHCHGSMGFAKSLGRLRVLNMGHCGSMEGSNGLVHIDNLPRLRYLGLEGSIMFQLPKEIGRLKLLQTLDLAGAEIEELPSSVGLLKHLLCLRIGSAFVSGPDWIGNLTSLQELQINCKGNHAMFVKALGCLKDLRVLNTTFDSGNGDLGSSLLESLGNMGKIKYVLAWVPKYLWKSSPLEAATSISSRHLNHLKLDCLLFSRMPEWINPSLLPNLSLLLVNVGVVKEQDMTTLGRMPELRSLTLFSYSHTPSVCIPGDATATTCFRKLVLFRADFDLQFTAAMPSLEDIEFTVDVQFVKEAAGVGSQQLHSEILPSLRNAVVRIRCGNDFHMRIKARQVEIAFMRAAAAHPNHPGLHIGF